MRTTDSSQNIYAQQIVELFSDEYAPELVLFACHAALPVVLNVEFLHLIRINFFLDALPYTAEAKLLHSPICEGRGNDLYEIQSDVRNILLQKLRDECGDDRLEQVAGLLWQYIDQRSPWEDHIRLKRAQQLTALNFMNPEKAQEWLAEAEEILNFQDTELRDWFVAIRKEIEQQKLAIQPYRLNRLISEQEIARIKKDYEQAARYQHSDPIACLMTSRRLAEDICRQLVAQELDIDTSGMMLYKLINKLSNDKILPYYIEAPLRAIHSYGNLGAQPQGKDDQKITPEFVQPCLQSLAVVVDWYINTYQPEEITSDWQQNEQAGETFNLNSDLNNTYQPKQLMPDWQQNEQAGETFNLNSDINLNSLKGIFNSITSDEYAFIKREFEKVLVYQYSDPMNCLAISRRIATDICKKLVVRELAEDASRMMLHKLINKLAEKKILPYYVAVPLRTIQNYGNLGAHAQGKDAEHITTDFVQPCIQSLAKVVDWYLHTYRPVQTIVFTARQADWQHIEQARVQLRPDLKIAFHEHEKDIDTNELLKICQTYANVLQTIPSIFLFPPDTPQHIRHTVLKAGKPFKAWGNRVFSLLLPEDVDFADIETFGTLFTILETILHIQSQTPIERQRRIDVAVPERTEINRTIDLLVQIRFPDSPLLGLESWSGKEKPSSVQQFVQSVNLKFPVDPQTGTLQALPFRITVQAPDFVIHGEVHKQIEIPPEQYSEVFAFLLTPKKRGRFQINIEIYLRDEKSHYVGAIPVETAVHSETTSDGIHVANLVVPVEVGRIPGIPKYFLTLKELDR